MNKKKLVGVIRKIVKEEVKKMGGQLKKQIVREVLNEVNGSGPSQSGDEMVNNIMKRRKQSEIGRNAQRQAGGGQQGGGVSQQADQMLNAHNRQGNQGQQQINAQQDPSQSFKQMMDQQYFGGGGQGQAQPQQQRQGGGRQNPVQETMNQHSAPLDENLTNRWKDLNEKMKNKKGHSPAAGAGGAQGPSPSQVSQSWKPGMFNDDQTLSEDAKQRLTEEKKRQRQPKRSKAKKAEINRDKNGQ
jgi:hypothetical protein